MSFVATIAAADTLAPDVDSLTTDFALTSDHSDSLLFTASERSNSGTTSDELELLAQLDRDWTESEDTEWDEALLDVLEESPVKQLTSW